MTDRAAYEPIPQPPGYPMLGNLFDVRGAETPIQALMKLAGQYGPIFQLRVGPNRLVVVSGFDLVDELCDEKRSPLNSTPRSSPATSIPSRTLE